MARHVLFPVNVACLPLITVFIALANAFNLTYPVANTTIIAHPNSNFTVARWTSSPSDPEKINIRIQANTRSGNAQQLCTNVTTSTGQCDIAGDSVAWQNGPDWEMVVVNSADPGDAGTPGSADVMFKSKPFALYLEDTEPSGSAVSTATATGGGGGVATASVGVGRAGAVVAGIAALML